MDLSTYTSHAEFDTDTKSFFAKVFMRMGVALAISGGVAWYVAGMPQIVDILFSNRLYFYGIMIIEFGLVRYLTANIKNLSLTTASLMFIIYSAINGAFLSVIFLVFELNSIVSLF